MKSNFEEIKSLYLPKIYPKKSQIKILTNNVIWYSVKKILEIKMKKVYKIESIPIL